MTPEELKEIRTDLKLTQPELGQALGLTGEDLGHTVRMWETGKRKITGPIARCMYYMWESQTLYYDRAGDIPLNIVQRDDLRKMAPATNSYGDDIGMWPARLSRRSID